MSATRSSPPADGVGLSTAPILTASDLVRRYAVRRHEPARRSGGSGPSEIVAVDGVSFSIAAGRTFALVGESGSGKTTIGRIVARLDTPDSGSIVFDGVDWLSLSGAALRRKRRDLQIVFQDPQTSLNPRMRVGDQIAEPLLVQRPAHEDAQRRMGRREIAGRVEELLEEVGLDRASARRFPAEFSGGQRQRIAIARALATRPKLLVCDEPVSALDASIAAQVVNLLLDLQRTLALSYLFISHDLALVGRVADSVAVVYLGRIVEEGRSADVIRRPLHPYTAALVSAVPDVASRPRLILTGEPVSRGPSVGCAFAPRCPIVRPRCGQERPPLAEVETGHFAACFYPGELRLPASSPAGTAPHSGL